jgi:AcrR family transcriptional regulator
MAEKPSRGTPRGAPEWKLASGGEMTAERDPQGGGLDEYRKITSFKIEEAALTLFAVRGVDAVTISEIVAKAGLSQRTFFRYFAAKDDIVLAFPRRSINRLVESVLDRPIDEGLFVAAAAAFRTAHELSPEEARLRNLWIAMTVRTKPPVFQGEMVDALRHAITDRLRRRRQDPSIAGPVAATISALIWFSYSEWASQGGKTSLPHLLEQNIALD